MYFVNNNERLNTVMKNVKAKRIKRLENRLKPCPFCGGKSRIVESYRSEGKTGYEAVYVMCGCCGIKTFEAEADFWSNYVDVAEAWNRRYSGINDKNGKPVYEGDRIRITGENWSDDIQGEYVVCYSDVDFTWYLKRFIYDAYCVYNRNISFSDLNLGQFTDDIELVKED